MKTAKSCGSKRKWTGFGTEVVPHTPYVLLPHREVNTTEV